MNPHFTTQQITEVWRRPELRLTPREPELLAKPQSTTELIRWGPSLANKTDLFPSNLAATAHGTTGSLLV